MLKKLFITNIIPVIFASAGNCFSENDLSGLEIGRYGHSYTNESIAERLSRLESDYFGMTQGGDIDSRLDMLRSMAENSTSASSILSNNDFYPGEKKSSVKNFWNNLTSTFSDASLTGFTPPLTSGAAYDWGYSGNMYRNNFYDFLNNPGGYCPYYNRQNRHRPFFNRGNGYNPPPRFNPNKNWHTGAFSPNNRYYPNRTSSLPGPSYGFSPYSQPYGRYIPTNVSTSVSTGTGIHIIRD